MEGSGFGYVNALAGAALSFAATSIVLGFVSAIVLTGLYEFGVRSLFQRLLVVSWFGRRPHELQSSDLAHVINMSPHILYALPYRQFCGQIGAAFQEIASELISRYKDSDTTISAEPRKRPEERIKRREKFLLALAGDSANVEIPNSASIPTTRSGANELIFLAERGIDALQSYLAFYLNLFNYFLSFFSHF
jgi:hypothetical protein